MVNTLSMTPAGEVSTDRPYPAAIALAFFSLLCTLLIFPALFQHYRNRNVGATVLVAITIIANMMVTTNAIIWSNDDMQSWYNGVGLCDIQVKLILTLFSMFPASVACILRALANVMDTNSTSWAQTTSQRRRNYMIDIVCCIVLPSLLIPLSYIVQPVRYNLMGIAGCQTSQDGSWLAFVFVFVPPFLYTLVGVYYAVLILVRLVRYRRTFNTILQNSSTTKSRFLRLYCVCCVAILALLPLQVFIIVQNHVSDLLPFDWNETHNNPEVPWNSAVLIPSYGAVYYDRIIWLVGGYLIFFFFGFGKDAMKTYRSCLLAIGLGRIFPVLRPDSQRASSVTGTISSLSSKAKVFFKRKDSNATWANSTTSTLTDTTSTSPKKLTLDSIREDHRNEDRRRLHASTQPMRQSSNPFARLISIFRKQPPQSSAYHDDPFALSPVGPNTFQSTVSADPLSPGTTAAHARKESHGPRDVLVMKEVRQASETAETLPSKIYEGV